MKLGDIEIRHLHAGTFRLDGGAMFGIVPKPLWSKSLKADPLNRILLGMNPLLIDNGESLILVDCGTGDKLGEKKKGIYAIDWKSPLAESGVSPETINVVILTHLHFDHCGGLTRRDDRGGLALNYPNAVHIAQRQEWEDASNPNERTKGSYLEENFLPISEAGKLQLVDGDSEISHGVRIIHTGGHTRGHQVVLIESKGEKALYFGDLVPTSYHLPLPYIMGYDLYPADTLNQRKDIYKKAIEEDWLVFFEHNPRPTSGYLMEEDGRVKLKRISGEDTRVGQ